MDEELGGIVGSDEESGEGALEWVMAWRWRERRAWRLVVIWAGVRASVGFERRLFGVAILGSGLWVAVVCYTKGLEIKCLSPVTGG